MAHIHTHYDNLKVTRNAPPEVIRAAYKTLSQKFHPDRNPDKNDATRAIQIINLAYDVLSDPVKRKEHDEWIATKETKIDHPHPSSDFEYLQQLPQNISLKKSAKKNYFNYFDFRKKRGHHSVFQTLIMTAKLRHVDPASKYVFWLVLAVFILLGILAG